VRFTSTLGAGVPSGTRAFHFLVDGVGFGGAALGFAGGAAGFGLGVVWFGRAAFAPKYVVACKK